MKYYTSCKTLPLKNFFDVVENNDFKYLVIADDYDFKLKKDLSELWQSLLNEYAELEGNDSIVSGFNAYREIHQLIYTYEIIQAMIFSLKYRYNRQYIDDLAMFGYKVEIIDNIMTLESLNRCSQMSRAIINDIEEIKNNIKPNDKKPAKNQFYKILAQLIRGYNADVSEDITVAKFIALKQLMQQNNGRDKRK